MARWFAMSTQFLADPKVEELGERHGPAGPLVIVALLSQAMLQERGGTVERTYRSLANDAFTDRETVKAIIEDAVTSRLVTRESRDVTRCPQDDQGVILTFPAWKKHQATFRKARSRQAQKGAEIPDDKADVTDSHAESRDVAKSHLQDRTRQDRTKGKENAGKPAIPRSEFDEWLSHYHEVTGRTSVSGSKPAWEAFRARRREGYSVDDLKAATVGCHSDAWRREKGHNIPETIFRAKNVQGYISQARDGESDNDTTPGRASPYDRHTEVMTA